MRMPRAQFTVRWMMIAVAIVAALLYRYPEPSAAMRAAVDSPALKQQGWYLEPGTGALRGMRRQQGRTARAVVADDDADVAPAFFVRKRIGRRQTHAVDDEDVDDFIGGADEADVDVDNVAADAHAVFDHMSDFPAAKSHGDVGAHDSTRGSLAVGRQTRWHVDSDDDDVGMLITHGVDGVDDGGSVAVEGS